MIENFGIEKIDNGFIVSISKETENEYEYSHSRNAFSDWDGVVEFVKNNPMV